MFQNIAFDRRQQTGKLLIQNAGGGRSISWHVAFLHTRLTLVSPARQHGSLPVPVPSTRLLGDGAQHTGTRCSACHPCSLRPDIAPQATLFQTFAEKSVYQQAFTTF